MGAIFKKHSRWYIDYYQSDGKRVRKAVSRYREQAELALKKVEVEMAECKYLNVKKSKDITFKEFAEKYRRKHIRRRSRSFEKQEWFLDGLIKYFGKRLMHEITVLDIDDYLELRHEGRSASTVNRDLAMLKSMYSRANEWGDMVNYHPAKNIKLLFEDNERCRFLTEEEQNRLLTACSGMLRMIVLVALRTGLRWGEIVNLKWQQAPKSNYVDFEHNTFFVHESLAKSKKSRYVPLAPSVKQALLDYPQHSETGYIFVNPKTNKQIVTLKKSFRKAVKKAKIEDFRFHDLRHCFASDLVRKGVDLFTVQKLLGHSSPKMTMRYAHLGNDHLRRAIHFLDKKKVNPLKDGHYLDTDEINAF